MGIKVCLAGATGWVGKPLSIEVHRAPDLTLVGAVSRSHSGKPLSEITDVPGMNLTICNSVEDALRTPTDVLVDYTAPGVVKSNVLIAIEHKVHVVIGTSGLTNEEYEEIDQVARQRNVGVIAVGNFALSAALLHSFALQAVKYMSHWEIIDYASAMKVDAPSGTARELAFRLSQIRKPESPFPVERTVGAKESRGTSLDGTQVHAIRLPSYTVALEIIFGDQDERLTLRYDAGTSAAPYLQGTLLAIRRVSSFIGLVRGLDHLMERSSGSSV
jgi:4-hydroxy-tetrahydrodipicolinate reductase